MARPEVTGKKVNTNKPRTDDDDDDVDSYTVVEFCRRNGFSINLFYKDRANMPRGYRAGVKVLISKEEAAAWRKARTEAAKSQPLVTDIFHKSRRDRRERETEAQ